MERSVPTHRLGPDFLASEMLLQGIERETIAGDGEAILSGRTFARDTLREIGRF